MKKLSSLIFAVVSTMFLAVGATRAAEKFDVTSLVPGASLNGPTADDGSGPGLPCIVIDPPMN